MDSSLIHLSVSGHQVHVVGATSQYDILHTLELEQHFDHFRYHYENVRLYPGSPSISQLLRRRGKDLLAIASWKNREVRIRVAKTTYTQTGIQDGCWEESAGAESCRQSVGSCQFQGSI